MSRYRKTLTGLVLGVAIVGIAQAQSIQINRENKTIAISTTDEATTVSDIAAITIGFEVYEADSESAYADGAKLSHAILEALHKAGVDDKSIESSSQGLQRNTSFDDKDKPEQRTKKQFVFRQQWEVSVSPQAAAEVIRAAIAAGANTSGAIDWRLTDRKALQAKAAEAALIKARGVAENMAEGLHVKLGALIYASNESPRTQLYFRPKAGLAMAVDSSEISALLANSPPLEIRPETIREEATVYAVFSIE